MLRCNFILGLYVISLCFKLIIIHDYTQTQRETKFKPRMKLNNAIVYMYVSKGFYYLVKYFPLFEEFKALAYSVG